MKNVPSYRAHKVKLSKSNAKNHNKSAIFIFLQPLLRLTKNWVLVTSHA